MRISDWSSDVCSSDLPQAFAALSDAQHETIIHAGEACERDLKGTFSPNKAGDQLHEDTDGAVYRTGFFIADGTGVGKGREGAGIILEQWNRGRRRAIWISRSSALIEDAMRDGRAPGGGLIAPTGGAAGGEK